MKIKDPKTGFCFDIRLDSDLLEEIQDELANIPEGQLDRLQVLRKTVSVCAERFCPIGDTARDRAYIELVVAHFCGGVLCAWCGEQLRTNAGTRGISHGICTTCTAKVDAAIDAIPTLAR